MMILTMVDSEALWLVGMLPPVRLWLVQKDLLGSLVDWLVDKLVGL